MSDGRGNAEFSASDRMDSRLLTGLHSAHLARAILLREGMIIPDETGSTLVRELLALQTNEAAMMSIGSTRSLEDVLRGRIGTVADWLKADRSPLEPVSVAFLLTIRKRVLELAQNHLAFADTAVSLASLHSETVIKSANGSLAGTVSTLGHSLLTFVYPTFRDLERLQHCYRSFNSCPCGVGSDATGARLPVDGDRLRQLLGFDDARQHSRDAIWQADGPIELMAAIVALLVNLNRLTDDLRSWLRFPDAVDTSWIRSLTSSLLAKVPALAALGKGGDCTENCLAVAAELDTALNGASRAIKLVTALIRSCAEEASAMAPAIVSVHQTDLSLVLVTRSGIDFSAAEKITTEVERLIVRCELDLNSLTTEALDVVAVQVVGRPLNLSAEDLASAVTPNTMIGTRRSPGGAAPDRVVAMVTECEARLVRENLWISMALQRLTSSDTLLLAEARKAAGL